MVLPSYHARGARTLENPGEPPSSVLETPTHEPPVFGRV